MVKLRCTTNSDAHSANSLTVWLVSVLRNALKRPSLMNSLQNAWKAAPTSILLIHQSPINALKSAHSITLLILQQAAAFQDAQKVHSLRQPPLHACRPAP